MFDGPARFSKVIIIIQKKKNNKKMPIITSSLCEQFSFSTDQNIQSYPLESAVRDGYIFRVLSTSFDTNKITVPIPDDPTATSLNLT